MVVLPIEDDDAVHACESAPSLLLLGAPGGGDDKSLETARRNMLVLRRPSSSSSDVLVFSPLLCFFFVLFLCVLCVCVLCVKTEEEEVSVLFLFFVSKNFIIIVLFQARFFRYIHQINFTSYRRIIRYRTMGMTTTTTLFARVLERRQHEHQHHERRTRRRICSSSSTKKSFSIKSHKVVSTQNNNNNNEEEEIKTTSRRRGREDGKCSFSRLASTTAVCFAASMTVATSTVILPVGGNTDFFSARADEQVEKCTKTVREKYA